MSAMEWKVKEKNVLQRELKGAEYLINVTEQNQSGNYQLIFSVTLDIDIPHHRLEKRFGSAYLALRNQYPLLGTRYSPNHLDQAAFDTLQTSQKAKEWLGQVTKSVRLSSFESVDDFARKVAQKPLDTPDRMSKAYLVLGPGNRQAGLVLHTSHALTGHYTVRIMDTFVKLLIEEEFEDDLGSTFQPEDHTDLVARLPGSLEAAYQKRFKPASEDISQELIKRQTIGNSELNPKLGIPLHQSWSDRKSLMQNLLLRFDKVESKKILIGMKRIGISPTTCVFASILYAIQHFFSTTTQNSTMKGCMLNFSTHASRWVPCEGQTGDPTISMAIVPSAVWIPTKSEDFEMKASEAVTILAKRIAEEQDRFLQSPHSMAYASEVAKMLKSTPQDAIQENQVSEKSNAVLTSQGPMPISRGHKNAKEEIRIIDYNHFGRNTDPTVCFSLYSVHGSLRIGTIFDERFFEVQKIDKILQMIGSLVRNLQIEDQTSARL